VSKLDEAQKRLQRAVSGLEEAAQARSSVPVADNGTAAADLEAAVARATELEAVNATVAEKLDGAILRVRKILED
jgi:hypothetical protein